SPLPQSLTTLTAPTFPTRRSSDLLTFSVTANNGVASTTSSPVNVTVNAPSVALNATTADPGQTVTATIANGPGNALDWVGLYPAGATSAADHRLRIRHLYRLPTAP